MIPHSTGTESVLTALRTDSGGLTAATAAELLRQNGANKLAEGKKVTNLQRFAAQFKDAMIIILIIAAAVSFGIAVYEAAQGHASAESFFEPALILAIVVLNAVMGVVQESKAEKALDALRNMSAPRARVVRDNAESVIDAAELVVGDIIVLDAGDFVPADARLIQSSSLKSEESALTGESVPSEKDATAVVADNAGIGDRVNMVFSGCSVTYGSGRAVVTAVGMDTEMGRIAGILNNEKTTETPLQKRLSELGGKLGIAALIACAAVFAVGLIRGGHSIMELFMVAVSLAVSAIPEGLPAVVTVVLSIGVSRMVKKNAVIRRLPAVETLGGASVICSDKTGTLTQNRMTLIKAYLAETGETEEITDSNSEKIQWLLQLGTLCSDGNIADDGKGNTVHIGDPTETSIVYAARRNGFVKEELNKKYPRLAALPFDSDRKMMSAVCEINGEYVQIVKGAFDSIATRCIAGDTAAAEKINNEMSGSALRVITIAVKRLSQVPSADGFNEDGLTLIGLVGMIDPPRAEAAEAVKICRAAGIRPVMITGDHVVTASAIAAALDIKRDTDNAVTGAELDGMDEDTFEKRVHDISVYARVSPENKIRIVKMWQKQGAVVAMTGDGVNDAPALKAADIGCAMGITGTDVAKGAADMTLTDDNFATIVTAVREGRGIYANIKKVVGYLLGTNVGEVLTVFFGMIMFGWTPLLAMQLLWVNLVTDSLPAVALGMEPVEDDIMSRKPKPRNEGIFAGGLGWRVLLQGGIFAVITLCAYYIGEGMAVANVTVGDADIGTLKESAGQTLAFMVLAVTQVFQSFNMRSGKSLFKIGLFSNNMLNIAAAVSLILMALVLFTPVMVLFGLTLLPAKAYLAGLTLAFVPTVITEIMKAAKIIKQ